MTIYLVGHAEAVSADAWQLADDSLRPLTPMGYAQATALARQLEPLPIDTVVAAPTSRCIDTVLPAAAAHGLEIRTRHDLLHPEAAALASELLRDRTRALLCADGAVISAALAAIVPEQPDPGPGDQAAASVWAVEAGPGGVRARRLPAVAPLLAEGGWTRRRRSGVVVGGGGRY